MADYKHTEFGVVRLSDGAFIPNDPGNRDWVAYQEYTAAGGDTDPEYTPDEIAAQQQAEDDADKSVQDLHALIKVMENRIKVLEGGS